MPQRIGKGLGKRVSGFLKNWSLPRQLAGEDVMSTAARSATSERLRPRLEQADRVGTSVCPFCAGGCGQLIYSKNGRPIHVEGDPRSPINAGTLCPKGGATLGMLLSPERITSVLHRKPRSDRWDVVPLAWAMERIAQLTKEARDDTFVERLPNGRLVNGTLGLGSLGGATMDNEENYLIKKLFGGGLGILNIENQARI
jgi:formate dehydrogenase major subunit